jgi:hypothetical protein
MAADSTHRLGHGLFILGAFILLIGVVILAPLNSGSSKAFGVSDIINLSNQARVQLNSPKLSVNTALMNAAQMKAEDMARLHYFAHTAPDGTVAWDYFKKVSYSYAVAGENLAITNEDAQAVINGWLNSPTHRDNLLSTQYTDFGIGMASYGEYEGHPDTYVVVAFYGKPADTQNAAAPTSPAGPFTLFKSNFTNIPPAYLVSVSVVLMAAGGLLEFRHIQRLHRQSQIA